MSYPSPKHRDNFRRLAIFDREGEALGTMLLHISAISAAYRGGHIMINVRGESFVSFNLNFTELVFDSHRDTFREYPQILLLVHQGNSAIIEDLDFKVMEGMLNTFLPAGRRDFEINHYRGAYNNSIQNKKYLA